MNFFEKEIKKVGLTSARSSVIETAREEQSEIPLIPCTTCNYCAKFCPMDIGISGSLTAKNIYTLYGNLDTAIYQEGLLVGGYGRRQAVHCTRCGACEGVCPQHIENRKNLAEIAKLFGQKE